MLKRIGLAILIVLIVIMMATFTANNTGMIDIDLAFAEITTSIPLVFCCKTEGAKLHKITCWPQGQ